MPHQPIVAAFLGKLLCIALFLGALPLQSQAQPEEQAVRIALAMKFEQIEAYRRLDAQGVPIAALDLVAEIYAENAFRPLWDSKRSQSLLAEISRAAEDGLKPADYHFALLQKLFAAEAKGAADAELVSDRDVLFTDAFARLAYHLYFGKADPERLDSAWNMTRDLGDNEPARVLLDTIRSDSVAAFLEELRPDGLAYRRTKVALAHYRGLAQTGGWQPLPKGAAIKPGAQDARVPALRARLALVNDYRGEPHADDTYDPQLEEAVKRFQARHGLEVDGIVGSGTLAAMNVSAMARVDQLRVNLERFRWVNRSLEAEFLIADIAGFGVYLIRDGQVVWETRAQVGKPYRETPVFRDEVKYLEFNPTWTVPSGILNKDVLPRAAKDPAYVQRTGFEILTRDGKRVDPAGISWAKYAKGGFPYMLRQPSGPNNALGRVKFMFPNPYQVYLHDTPSKSLFDRSARAFSSGCIRIDRPLELAELLLAGTPGWDRARIDAVLSSGKTTRAFLETPMPVYLMYLTAFVDDENQVLFRDDIYDRDERVLQALEGEFQIRKSVQEALRKG